MDLSKDWSFLVKNYLMLAACGTFALSTVLFAQTASTPNDEQVQASAGASPIAYIYISSTAPGGGSNEIKAFAAAPNGKLTSVHGSPFQENVTSMAVNGEFLFAVNTEQSEIETFRIESGGALRYATTTGTGQAGDCAAFGPLFLDHTGASLYTMEFRGNGCSNNTYTSYAIEKSTGGLKYMGNSANDWLYLPASFTGNNLHAYTASCIEDLYWGIYGFERSSDGLLTQVVAGKPPTPPAGDFYCPSQAAADPTDHVAFSMQAVNGSTFNPDGLPRLASYTADASGNLTTTSTRANMPETSVVTLTDLNMSPSGKLLAVAGTGGLQIFHFDGSEPIKPYTALLTKDEIDQLFWDNQNHLYAISHTADKLFVFTITPTSYAEAPGSPYTINKPQNIIVQPLK
jgi:hypothetical protein